MALDRDMYEAGDQCAWLSWGGSTVQAGSEAMLHSGIVCIPSKDRSELWGCG
jgi:hypothetical protein